MRCASADDDHVGGFERSTRAVGVEHRNLRPWLERFARASCEARLDLDSGDFAGGTCELSEKGRVVASAASEVEDLVAGLNAERFEVNSPQAGLTVVEVLRFIEHNKSIAVDPHGVRIGSYVAFAIALNDPWSWPHEALPRNGGECGEDGRRRDAVTPGDLLGIEAASGFDRFGHSGSSFRKCYSAATGFSASQGPRWLR